MEFNQIVELIKTVSASELTTFRYEEGNQKILIQSGNETVASVNDTGVVKTLTQQTKKEGELVKSPLVGRFYAAPSQDAEPFVKVGDTVKKGQTLAIVEAMKLMNEIESEYDGVVAEIFAENEQSVEYGQVLFRIV